VAASNCELIDSLERDWRDSLCAHDIERLRELIHPRFTLIGTRATGPFILSRDEWLEAVQKRELISIDIDIKDAVVLENVMVGTVEAKWRVSYLGRPIEDCVLLTDVWVREDGQWQVVRRHSSPIPIPESSSRSKNH
jgi:ketosteroid isomerase-like protein